MIIKINSEERVFAVHGHGQYNPILCNLNDLENVYSRLIPVTKIEHLWDGRFKRISRKEVAEMLKANELNYSFL